MMGDRVQGLWKTTLQPQMRGKVLRTLRATPPCTRAHAPAFCTPSRPTSLHLRTRPRLLHALAPHVLAPAHTSFLLHVIARSAATWQSVTLRHSITKQQHLGRIRKA